MVRALGIDLGDRRVGVAKSDPSGTMASPLIVLQRRGDDRSVIADIVRLVDEWEIEVVVVGMPYSLDGGVGPAARSTAKRIEALSDALPVPVETYDERLTTTTASRLLHDSGVDAKRQRGVIDKVAAAIILQGWLDAQSCG